MGIEYFIQGHRDGEAAGVPLQLILRAFDKQESDHKDGFYRLSYDAAHTCDFTVTVEDEVVTVICIYKPCAHERLFQSIFEVLCAGPYVLFSPGGNAPVIARPDVIDNLPDGMIGALGEPVVVDCADDIFAALQT